MTIFVHCPKGRHMESRESARVEAAGRAAVYSLLARLFSEELDVVAIAGLGESSDAVLGVLRDLGADPESLERLDAAGQGPSGAACLELAVEYERLFGGQNRVHPFASCWVPGGKPRLLGPQAAAAAAFYAESGVGVDPADAYRMDHVGVELGYLALVAEKIAVGSDDDVDALQDRYARFMAEIVVPWMPRFFDAVAEDSRADFYAAAARVAKRFVEIDADMLGIENAAVSMASADQ